MWEKFEKKIENGLTPEEAKELFNVAQALRLQVKDAVKEGEGNTLRHFLGRTMPQAEEMEQSVIGVLLLWPKKIDTVLRLLTPDHFYSDKWKIGFEVIVAMYKEGRKIDLLTVSNYIATKKILGITSYDLVEATRMTGSSDHVTDWMTVIYDKYASRKLMELAYSLPQDVAKGKDVPMIIDEAMMELRRLITLDEGEVKTPEIYIPETIELIKKEIARGDEINGTRMFGIQEVDYKMNGIEDGDLVIVAARPKMGKTATFVNFAITAIQHQQPILLMSGEIPNKDMVKRMLSVISDTDISDIRYNRYDLGDPHIQAGLNTIFNSSVYLSDRPLSMKTVRDRISEYYDKGVRRFGIDRFELFEEIITAKDQNTARTQLSSKLRRMVNEYQDIGIVMVSQMSAAHTKTTKKKPTSDDIFGATALQSDCTKMIGLYRPDQYGILADDKGADLSGKAEILFLAGNNIPNGESVWVSFDKRTASFKEIKEEFSF